MSLPGSMNLNNDGKRKESGGSQRGGKMGKRTYDTRWFYGCLLMITCIFSVFFVKYVNYADTPLHSLVAKSIFFQDTDFDAGMIPRHAYAYPVYHIVQKMVHFIFRLDYETAAAIILSVSIFVSVLLYRKLILMIVRDTDSNKYFADFLALGSVLFEVARCWLNDWRFYQSQCGPNPFHNPTILFVRPIGTISLICFIKYIQNYRQKKYYRYVVLFGLCMLISIGAKPSYALAFLPAMGIYTLYYMIRNKEIWFGVIAFAAVLPSLILLVVQQVWVSSQTQALNVTVGFGGFTGLTPIQVVLSSLITFPVVILLFRVSLIKREPVYFISITALVIGWIQMFWFSNGPAGDFSWGYDLAVQAATIVTLAETRKGEEFNRGRNIINRSAYVIFLYQVLTGVVYLWTIYNTTMFWI